MYQCLDEKCKKNIIHLGKFIETKSKLVSGNTIPNIITTEVYGCPFCGSWDYIEIEKLTLTKGKVIELISVPHAEVNKKIAEGYELLDEKDKVFAKETILVKREKPTSSPPITEVVPNVLTVEPIDVPIVEPKVEVIN